LQLYYQAVYVDPTMQ